MTEQYWTGLLSYKAAQSLLSAGVSRPTLYAVDFGSKVGPRTRDHVKYFCNSVTVPEARMNTIVSLGHSNIGITREMPTALVYSKPLTMSFIEIPTFQTYNSIKGWFNTITQNSNGGLRNQHMNFYGDYVEDIKIFKLECVGRDYIDVVNSLLNGRFGNFEYQDLDDIEGNSPIRPVMVWDFKNAYPINIGPISLSSQAFNAYTTFNVSFTYEVCVASGITNPLDDLRGLATGVLL
jgi:hypothetical protein